MHTFERPVTLLASAAAAFAAAVAYPVEPVLMPDAPIWAKVAMAALVFLMVFVLLLPVWLPAQIPSRRPRLAAAARLVAGVLLLLVGLASLAFVLLVAGLRVHLILLATLGFVVGAWHLRHTSRGKVKHQ